MKQSVLFIPVAAVCLLFAGQTVAAQGAIVNGATYKMTHYGVTADASATAFGVPAGTPLCLDVDNNLTTAGTSIGQWGDNGNDAQRYIFVLQADGSYKLRHKGTTMYVQTVALSKAANAQIEQNVLLATNDDAQRWFITDPNSNGRYKFTLKNSANAAGISQCLEVGFGSAAPGARVNLFDDNGFEPAQRWQLLMTATPTATKKAEESVLQAQAYPNPSGQGQSLTVRVETISSSAAELAILDMLGNTVYRQPTMLRAGANVVPLANKQLAAGVYVMRVRQGDFVQQTRVVQQ